MNKSSIDGVGADSEGTRDELVGLKPVSPPSDDLVLRRLQTETFLEFARLVAIEHQRLRVLFEAEGLEGVTPGQSRVLMILFQARRPLTARDVSRRMGVSEVTMGRFVKGLLAGGWVKRQRSESDKRSFELHPTEQARASLPQFIRVSNQVLDDIFAGFEPCEIDTLASIIARIRHNLDGTISGT